MKSKQKAKPASPIYKKWWFWAIVIVAVIGIAGNAGNTGQPQGTTPPTETTAPEETTTAPEQTTTAPVKVNEYAVVEKFVELYNASSEIPISDLVAMDIQGEDYRTEFRLNAFKNAVGQKGSIATGTIEVVNYGVWDNDSIRIYARVDSHDAAIEIVYNIIHILDSSVTDDQIADDVSTEHSILLGDRNQISGFISPDYADGGIVGYDVMIDCSNVDFAK